MHESNSPLVGCSTELCAKYKTMNEFLDSHQLDAYLISRHENIAWATAGRVDTRVGLLRETGSASLLFTRNRRYYLCSNNEFGRLKSEEFIDLDYEPLVFPWHAMNPASLINQHFPTCKLAADGPNTGFPILPFGPVRLCLNNYELDRYRWLGKSVAEIISELLPHFVPGMNEQSMQAMVASRLLDAGILPSVLLIAVDDRVRNFRHAVARHQVLRHLGMINLCARRWGLAISITRMVYWGTMPAELQDKFDAVSNVYTHLLYETRVGVSAKDLFRVAQQSYLDRGYSGEEWQHHIGGATGYWEREWLARPEGREQVMSGMAFAWNPTLQGAKIEDTVVCRDSKIEVLTETPQLPTAEHRHQGSIYRTSDVLMM